MNAVKENNSREARRRGVFMRYGQLKVLKTKRW
jgi:hypothetical protein